MEMADSSESSDDTSGKSRKQLTDNTRRLKKKIEGITVEIGNWQT